MSGLGGEPESEMDSLDKLEVFDFFDRKDPPSSRPSLGKLIYGVTFSIRSPDATIVGSFNLSMSSRVSSSLSTVGINGFFFKDAFKLIGEKTRVARKLLSRS